MKVVGTIYHRNEGAGPWWRKGQWRVSIGSRKREGWSVFELFSGWWTLLDKRFKHFEAVVQLGDSGDSGRPSLTFGIVIPRLLVCYVGVRVPRKLTESWIYHEREWGFRIGYIGHWLDVFVGYDDHLESTGMVSYYKELRANPNCKVCAHSYHFHTDPVSVPRVPTERAPNGKELRKLIPNPGRKCITEASVAHGAPECECPGYVPAPPSYTRVATWPGLQLTLKPRLCDWLFGPKVCKAEYGDWEEVVVPMPEGSYPARVRPEAWTWKRHRLPWFSARRVDWECRIDKGIPFPGKGENAWDCGDDGLFGCGGSTKWDAVGNAVAAVLEYRDKYGGRGWVPDGGWRVSCGFRMVDVPLINKEGES